jgi:hypothetical protein
MEIAEIHHTFPGAMNERENAATSGVGGGAEHRPTVSG